jgi:hypothetical protein
LLENVPHTLVKCDFSCQTPKSFQKNGPGF